MVSWATVSTLLLACVMYGAFCCAIVRVFLRSCADQVSYWLVAAWGGCFAVAIVGTLMTFDAFGLGTAAVFEAVACLASFVLCGFLGRWWRNRAMDAAVAYLHRQRAAPHPAVVWASDLDERCAHLARLYDLTRREEDVLRLLMEGCTFAQAADRLVVSLNTVKSHVRRIYAKLGVRGKQDLLEKVRLS